MMNIECVALIEKYFYFHVTFVDIIRLINEILNDNTQLHETKRIIAHHLLHAV